MNTDEANSTKSQNPYAPPQADVDPLPRIAPSPAIGEPVGLGGWLVLFGLGLVLSPLRILMFLLQTYPPIIRDGTWNAVTDPESAQYIPMFGVYLIGEIAINCLFIVMFVLLSIKFFRKSRSFPKLAIVVLVGNLTFVIVDAILGSVLFSLEGGLDAETGREIGKSIIGALIWIPYLLLSKRVRNTFIE